MFCWCTRYQDAYLVPDQEHPVDRNGITLPDRGSHHSTSWFNPRNFTGYPVRQHQGFHMGQPEEHGPHHYFENMHLFRSGSTRAPIPVSEYQVLENNEFMFPMTFGSLEHLSSFLMSFGLENSYLLHRIREGLFYHHLEIRNGAGAKVETVGNVAQA